MSPSSTPTPTPAPASAHPIAGSAAAAPAPTRARFNRPLAGLSAALIAAGGLGGWWLMSQGQEAQPVMVAATNLPAGHTITHADLTPVQVVGQAPFAATSDASALVGKVTGTQIPANSVISPAMVGTAPNPGEGTVVIGVPVKSTQMPALGLQPADAVSIVAGSAPGTAATAKPASWPGRVVTLGEPNADGVRVVDVAVVAAAAPAAASATTTGTAVLTFTSRGQ